MVSRALLDDLAAWHGDFAVGVVCGSPSELRIEWGDKSINCSGSSWRADAAPRSFREFVAGVAKLVGPPATRLSHWSADK